MSRLVIDVDFNLFYEIERIKAKMDEYLEANEGDIDNTILGLYQSHLDSIYETIANAAYYDFKNR